MCGLVAWLSNKGNVDADQLVEMRDRLAHRGPDGAGLWLAPENHVGLGHRRLSIIDLSTTANQPMEDAARDAVLVFNGEIYNHAELRVELEELGANFQTTHSDTEVILQGYLHRGIESLLERLNGMFAFVIYDRRNERAYAVRDRIGIKPLYLTQVGGEVLIASEIKGLLAHPQVARRLNQEAFVDYLSFRAPAAPNTLFEGIECLRAGELAEYDLRSGRSSRRVWWNPLESRGSWNPKTFDEATEQLEQLLQESIDYRMIADVPVGLFLSGGVDSGYLLKQMSPRVDDLNTYTVIYGGETKYNEGDDARRLAGEVNSTHHEVVINADAFCDAFPRVAYHQDEPIAAPVCSSVYFLSERTRNTGVKVVLAGEGADEVFIGYRNWIRTRDLERWNQRVPQVPGRPLRQLASLVGSTATGWTSPHREILRRAAAGQPLFWAGGLDFGEAVKSSLLGPAVKADHDRTYGAVIEPLYRQYLNHRSAADIIGWMTYSDLNFRLPQLMLPRLDKMGMAFSIEGRVPFLDHRIVEFALSLPPEWRGGVGQVGKAIFKRIAAKSLDHDYVYREKRGFQAPVKEWRDAEFGQRYLPVLKDFANRTGLLNIETLDRLITAKNSRLYFSLINLAVWHQVFIEQDEAMLAGDTTTRFAA